MRTIALIVFSSRAWRTKRVSRWNSTYFLFIVRWQEPDLLSPLFSISGNDFRELDLGQEISARPCGSSALIPQPARAGIEQVVIDLRGIEPPAPDPRCRFSTLGHGHK